MNWQSKRRAMLAMLLLAASGSAYAAVNVRGRIDFNGAAGTIPMANATVSVCASNNACIDYVTGNDGMFYMQLEPGQYSISVNGVQKTSVAIPDQPNFDISAIMGN